MAKEFLTIHGFKSQLHIIATTNTTTPTAPTVSPVSAMAKEFLSIHGFKSQLHTTTTTTTTPEPTATPSMVPSAASTYYSSSSEPTTETENNNEENDDASNNNLVIWYLSLSFVAGLVGLKGLSMRSSERRINKGRKQKSKQEGSIEIEMASPGDGGSDRSETTTKTLEEDKFEEIDL
jgi:hypothetical protein